MADALQTLMMPARGDGKGDNVLAHAAVLARRFGAQVRVVHCHLTPKDLMPFGVVIPAAVKRQIEAAAANNVEAERDKLLAEFRALAREFGLAEQDHEAGKATARFIEYEGKQVDAVRRFGRLSDLICVPQPDPALNLGKNTLKSALFGSARPVMMCPPQDRVEDGFADHITIGWNGSLEASRAVALTMPLLTAAKEVTILHTKAGPHDASAEDLQRYLELKGVHAKLHPFTAKSSVVGTQLLQETQSIGAGLLVMGAYHDSYERETIFGGNSQAVVEQATQPVIMVH